VSEGFWKLLCAQVSNKCCQILWIVKFVMQSTQAVSMCLVFEPTIVFVCESKHQFLKKKLCVIFPSGAIR
jgi:hypothetical protein